MPTPELSVAPERPTDGPAPPVDRAAQLSLFGFMWAVAVLVHLLADPGGLFSLRDGTLVGFQEAALAAAAIALALRPSDRRLLASVGILQVVNIWLDAPLVGNHWLLAGLVGASLAAAVGHAHRTGDRSADGLVRRFAPIARLTLLVAYAFIAFAKINPAFLDPVTSCAVRFTGDLTAGLGFDASDLAAARWARGLPTSVLVVEASIPLLLLARRTRHAGVVIALVFHLLVGLDVDRHFWDFSAVLAPLFVLFLPPEFAVAVRRRLGARRAELRAVVAVVAAVLLADGVLWSSGVPDTPFRLVGYLVWLVYAAATVALVVDWLARTRQTARAGLLRPLAPILLVVPALALANGISTYLEVKTTFGFNMYSNLHLSGGETNHYLLPATLPVDGRGGDTVTIVDSTDPGLLFYAETGWQPAWTELRAYLAERPATSLVYERAGTVVALERADLDPDLVAPVGVAAEKLRAIRAVDPDGHPDCQAGWGPAR